MDTITRCRAGPGWGGAAWEGRCCCTWRQPRRIVTAGAAGGLRGEAGASQLWYMIVEAWGRRGASVERRGGGVRAALDDIACA